MTKSVSIDKKFTNAKLGRPRKLTESGSKFKIKDCSVQLIKCKVKTENENGNFTENVEQNVIQSKRGRPKKLIKKESLDVNCNENFSENHLGLSIDQCDILQNQLKSKKIKLIQKTEAFQKYSLPYGWIKICRLTRTDRWYFYLISPNGKKFRSNPEVYSYLEANPDVKYDKEVTYIGLGKPQKKHKSLKKKKFKKDYSGKEIWEINPFALQRKLEALEEFGFVSCAMCKEALSCQSEVSEHYWFEHQIKVSDCSSVFTY